MGRDQALDAWMGIGELTLDGDVRPVRGVIAAAEAARASGRTSVLVPRPNADEAAAVGGVAVYGVRSLAEAVAHLAGRQVIARHAAPRWRPARFCGRFPLLRQWPCWRRLRPRRSFERWIHAFFTIAAQMWRPIHAKGDPVRGIQKTSTQKEVEEMEEFCACRNGFRTATAIFAQAVLTQSVILSTCFLIGAVVLF